MPTARKRRRNCIQRSRETGGVNIIMQCVDTFNSRITMYNCWLENVTALC